MNPSADPSVDRVVDSPGVAVSASFAGRAVGLRYALVTPARDEARFIEQTILSIIHQTVRPIRWVIVSDGSTDGTDAIVRRYASAFDWITLVRAPDHAQRDFAAKARAFGLGYSALTGETYDVIGSLDADITFDESYFAFLLERFADDPLLGVAGTPFRDGPDQYDYRFTNIEHVSGACQMFRRACFEAVGGYVPVRGGGIDWIAVTTARMKGWHTRTFCEKVCHHHRPIGTAQRSRLQARFRQGMKDHGLGGHPLWQLFRAVHQMRNRPYVVGGLVLLAGYGWAWGLAKERSIDADLIRFHRDEQLRRLGAALRLRPWRRLSEDLRPDRR